MTVDISSLLNLPDYLCWSLGSSRLGKNEVRIFCRNHDRQEPQFCVICHGKNFDVAIELAMTKLKQKIKDRYDLMRLQGVNDYSFIKMSKVEKERIKEIYGDFK